MKRWKSNLNENSEYRATLYRLIDYGLAAFLWQRTKPFFENVFFVFTNDCFKACFDFLSCQKRAPNASTTFKSRFESQHTMSWRLFKLRAREYYLRLTKRKINLHLTFWSKKKFPTKIYYIYFDKIQLAILHVQEWIAARRQKLII